MTLIFGTRNSAKLAYMRSMLKGLIELGHSIIGLDEAGLGKVQEPEEDGSSPSENAAIKARFYYKMLNKPVFSVDSWLYFDGLPNELQPGVHIRRVSGKRLNDEEMTDYYARLASRFGGKLIGRYVNAICLAAKRFTHVYCGDDIASLPFAICDKPHSKKAEGFPLDRLSVSIDSGRYFYDIERETEKQFSVKNGFYNFFKRIFDNYVYGLV